MMLPVSRYVSPVKASSSFYKRYFFAVKAICLAIFCCLATIEVARGDYLKEVLNSTYVEVVCWYMRSTKVVQGLVYLVIVTNS